MRDTNLGSEIADEDSSFDIVMMLQWLKNLNGILVQMNAMNLSGVRCNPELISDEL